MRAHSLQKHVHIFSANTFLKQQTDSTLLWYGCNQPSNISVAGEDSLKFSNVTECIVYVPGHDPLIFSFLSFSFLIGWEFYGPNYLKCQNLCAGPAASSFPQCPCSSRSSVNSSCCLCIWFKGEPTLFPVGANESYVIATSTVPEEWDTPSWAGWPTSWFLWTADFAHLTSARCPKRGQQLREVHCGAML